MAKESLSGKVTFELGSEQHEGVKQANIWRTVSQAKAMTNAEAQHWNKPVQDQMQFHDWRQLENQ